jgi:hypothetical protein
MNNNNFISSLLIDNHDLLMKLNTSYIECSFLTLIDNQSSDIGWGFLNKNTNLQNHPFQHSFTSSNTFQGLLVSLFEYTHNIIVWDSTSHILSTLCCAIFVMVFVISFHKTIIIF